VQCCHGAAAAHFPRFGQSGVGLWKLGMGSHSSAVGGDQDQESGEMAELHSLLRLMAFSASARLRGSHNGYF
jgi:hypothetical protein